MELIVLYLSRKSNAVHEYVNIEPSVSYPIAFAKNPNEFVFYVRHLESLAFIETSTQTWGYRLTPKGWERVIELKRVQEDSNQAFVAMWFNEALNPIWENGFKPALEATRFNPLRIDRVEHNQRIDDRIIAEIRRSGLVVADFTGNRGGVYFEAGFAMGLGITVIWTCRTGDIDNVHFDTRQYNHLVWNDATELRDKLVARIEATIPGHLRTT